MEFQVQSVCLIYTRLLVYTILTLAYPKSYMYYISLICGITLLFWNLLYPFVQYVTVCDSHAKP